ALATSGLIFSPANAATVTCTEGGDVEITNNVVDFGRTCVGAVVIPSGVTSIGDDAFFAARSLTSITIPASVTTIANAAFRDSSALNTITFEPNSQLTRIGDYAFRNVTALTSITIPVNVSVLGDQAFRGTTSLINLQFLGNAPATVGSNLFVHGARGAKAYIKSGATGFGVAGDNWNGLIVEVVVDPPAAAPAGNSAPAPAGNSVPTVETPAQVADTGLAARTIGFKKKYSAKTLAKQVGIKITSPKAKVSISAAKSSKKVCTKSGAKLRTLNAGNCVVTFTVQEPKPKKGNKPKATKTVMTLAVR
ncbi:MAG: leucine-rich repeat protein, partial [Actinobacteria bacterium]|nr:leucine-rich repeat protein [Actinomycetota bacterium]